MTHTLDKTAVKAILDALDDAERHSANMNLLDHQEARQIWLNAVRLDLRVARNRLLNVALTDVEVETDTAFEAIVRTERDLARPISEEEGDQLAKQFLQTGRGP